ncbi:MAG TPA: Hsp33 family molecular chaperone HslO [Thermoanaerobaculia bacterium]|nr:Hsp33 family molecular chaperone HslO [Thermoanaerobaculia bacterium]
MENLDDDRLIQGMAWSGDFRIIAAKTTSSLNAARLGRDLSPVASAALGRAMTGAVLLARLLDKQVKQQHVTLRFDGKGPLGVVIAEGTFNGTMRGYVTNPAVEDTAVDVGAGVGNRGLMTVTRKTPPLGKAYASQVELVSGEIAKDIVHFLATSEQIASAVMLGVLTNRQGVAAAGGMIVQAFPHASLKAIEAMEDKIRQAPSFSSLLEKMPLEEAVQEVLRGADYKAIDASFNTPLAFQCSCTRERALASFQYFSRQELGDMIEREGGSEATCQFCGQKYTFSGEDLLALSSLPDA